MPTTGKPPPALAGASIEGSRAEIPTLRLLIGLEGPVGVAIFFLTDLTDAREEEDEVFGRFLAKRGLAYIVITKAASLFLLFAYRQLSAGTRITCSRGRDVRSTNGACAHRPPTIAASPWPSFRRRRFR